MLLDLASGLAQSCLISPEPASPAVLGRHDPSLEKLACSLTEVAWVLQQRLGVAQIVDIQHLAFTPITFPSRTKELVLNSPRLRASSISGVYWMKWTLRIRSFEHQVIAPRLLVLPMNEHPALDGSDLPQIEHLNGQALV